MRVTARLPSEPPRARSALLHAVPVDEASRDVQALILAKLMSGQLPTAKPEKVWAGKGTGQPCSACGLAISADDVEYEVDFPGVQAAMRLHQACLTTWDQNRKDFSPNVDAA